MRRSVVLPGLLILILLVVGASGASAQELKLEDLLPGDSSGSRRIILVFLLLTVLSVAPALLVMVTCFTRFVIAFALLRAGLGLQTTPSNIVMLSLALFMTLYVMAPTFDRAWTLGVEPYIAGKVDEKEAVKLALEPFQAFMKEHVRDKDLALFQSLAPKTNKPVEPDREIELRVLVPAFMISELRRGFEIGFLIILPFLVIDIIVAIITMSVGMMMLPPTVISLPFKILFFVLVDGWNLVVEGMISSF